MYPSPNKRAHISRENPHPSRRRQGFTLLELVIAMTLSGLVISTLVLFFQNAVKRWDRIRNMQATAMLSQDLMDEIRSKNFTDPEQPDSFGPEPDETARNVYDDVDDYDNMSNRPPRAVEGAALSNCANISVSVKVENVQATNLNAAVPEPDGSTSFKRITILLSAPGMTITNISAVGEYD
jgi:MSHA pilin protein MshD